MAPKANNNMSVPGAKGRVIESKRKIYVASALVAVMAFMWVRVFMSDKAGPESTEAAQVQALIESTQQEETIKISYIDLAVVPGRNDILTHDMFGSKSFRDETEKPNIEAVDVTTEQGDPQQEEKELVAQAAKMIKLNAITVGVNGNKNEAFIGDKLMLVGQTFDVVHDRQKFTFTISQISKNKVVLKWNELSVTIWMSREKGLDS